MEEQTKNSVERMKNIILKKGLDEIQHDFLQQKKELETQFEHQSHILLRNKEQQLALVKRNMRDHFQQEFNHYELQFKRTISVQKQQYLHQLFQKALETMRNWPKKQFLANTKGVFVQNTLTGDVEVIVGEWSKEQITQYELDHFSEEHGNIRYHLSKEQLSDDGGFSFLQNGIEYNYSFSNLIEEIKEKKETQLAKKIFG